VTVSCKESCRCLSSSLIVAVVVLAEGSPCLCPDVTSRLTVCYNSVLCNYTKKTHLSVIYTPL
jgi:hypothetical protein